MIVTADPLGDFNATSQILRYSALAREVTVPRIPSVTSTILSATTGGNSGSNKSQLTSGRTSPNSAIADEAVVEMAFSEIARLTEEVEILGVRLADEEQRRREAEDAWQRVEEKVEGIEREVREECWEEMERKIEEERRRWINAWGEEVVLQLQLDLQRSQMLTPDKADRNDEHLDRKLEILSQGIQSEKDLNPPTQHILQLYKVLIQKADLVHEDDASSLEETHSSKDLEAENDRLLRKVDALERELQIQSPTRSQKKKQQREPSFMDDCGTTLFKLNSLSLNSDKGMGASPMKTPGSMRKVRKLTARKWDLGDENELLDLDGYGAY